MNELYSQHVRERQREADAALAAAGFDAMVVQAGTPFTYHADDQKAPFRTAPHFAHWVPLEGPHHLLLVRPGARALLVRVRPEDYWYEQAPLGDPYWLSAFDFKEVPDSLEAWKIVASKGKIAYVGDSPASAQSHRLPADSINPETLIRFSPQTLEYEKHAPPPHDTASGRR